VRGSSAPPLRVLFRVAAGSRQGFGHLVRARVLSRALGIRRPLVSLRGSGEALAAASRLGFRVVDGPPLQVFTGRRPAVVVIDDPTERHGRRWVRAAQRCGIPTASIHDLGLAFCGADLSVDGSLRRAAWPPQGRHLVGPRFAILDPGLRRVKGRRRDPARVLVALGGGPRRAVAARVAGAIVKRRPEVTVRIAAGFVPRTTRTAPGIHWLPPQPGLADELSRCGAALLGGGMSLYEAAAIGTPAAAWPVVRAQMPTVRAFVREARVVPVLPGPRRTQRAAAAICRLLDRPPVPATLFDLDGAHRVARAIRRLAAETRGEGR
jgi:hypothetical protein